ncbi:MAG: DUF3299 domain-containing protein [Burkholderiales bacterium]
MGIESPAVALVLAALGAWLPLASVAQTAVPRSQPTLPAASAKAQEAARAGSVPGTASRDVVFGGNPPPDFGSHAGAQPLVSPPLPKVEGAVPWDLLGQVKSVPVGRKVVPQFPAAVSGLNRSPVKVVGFMMPLQAGERQSHFLLTATSQTCAFCIPVGPEGIIEVRMRKPIKAGFDAILIAGRLEVLQDDPQGIYYRIRDAESLPLR